MDDGKLLEAIIDILVGDTDGVALDRRQLDRKRKRHEAEAVLALIRQDRRELLEQLSMEVIEPCEPECDPVRHARHEGTWQAHLVIEQHLTGLEETDHE